MDAITDLLSSMAVMLAWIFPLLLLFFARRRAAAKRRENTEPAAAEETTPPAAMNPRRASDRDHTNFIARLMEIQGISPPPEELPEVYDRSLHIMEQEQEPEPVKPSQYIFGGKSSAHPITSVEEKNHTNPLSSFDRLSPGRRAIILSEIIGKPKALSDQL